MDAAATVPVSSDDVAMNKSGVMPETSDFSDQLAPRENANGSEPPSQPPESNISTRPVRNRSCTVRFDNSWF